jgi:hypothetical protein
MVDARWKAHITEIKWPLHLADRRQVGFPPALFPQPMQNLVDPDPDPDPVQDRVIQPPSMMEAVKDMQPTYIRHIPL